MGNTGQTHSDPLSDIFPHTRLPVMSSECTVHFYITQMGTETSARSCCRSDCGGTIQRGIWIYSVQNLLQGCAVRAIFQANLLSSGRSPVCRNWMIGANSPSWRWSMEGLLSTASSSSPFPSSDNRYNFRSWLLIRKVGKWTARQGIRISIVTTRVVDDCKVQLLQGHPPSGLVP